MAVTGLLHFNPKLGICLDQKSSKQFKCSFRRSELQLPAANLPSISLGQDLLTQHILKSIKRPICSVPLRHGSFICRSSLLSDSHITSSCLKTVTTALTSPSIIKLITAVSVVVFTLWGLGPLLRSCRNLFLQKNENGWRKSTTNYVMTSYLQPALLWTGAMLVCSTLDPVVMPTEASGLVKQRVVNFVRSLSTVLSFAYCISCTIQQTQKFFTQTSDPSDTRNMGFQFAAKAVHSAVWVAAVALFMELLGFSTQKLLTAGGLGTVLLTLAGREIFTNFLSSAMIHATRPFLLNEWIQTKIEGYEVSGTVEHVGWWSPTIIRGEDREAVHIPNHKFTMNVVRNLTQKTHWRIKIHLAISHLDANKINNIVADMRKVLAKNPQVEQQRLHRRVFFDYVEPENQALLILVSCFVKTPHHEEYYCVKEAILLDLLRVIRHHRARLATPIRTFQRVYSDAEVENVPSEPAYSRSRAAPHRPFLLVESSYKVNGEDKAKPPRSTRAGGDQDGQATGQQPISDSKLKGKSPSESKNSESSKTSTKVEVSNGENSVVKQSATAGLDKKPGSEETQLGGVSSESGNKNTNGPSSVSPQSKQSAKASSSGLEENIVLGVALEGSKRILLIDDDHLPVEAKEAPANQNSTPASDSDENDK